MTEQGILYEQDAYLIHFHNCDKQNFHAEDYNVEIVSNNSVALSLPNCSSTTLTGNLHGDPTVLHFLQRNRNELIENPDKNFSTWLIVFDPREKVQIENMFIQSRFARVLAEHVVHPSLLRATKIETVTKYIQVPIQPQPQPVSSGPLGLFAGSQAQAPQFMTQAVSEQQEVAAENQITWLVGIKGTKQRVSNVEPSQEISPYAQVLAEFCESTLQPAGFIVQTDQPMLSTQPLQQPQQPPPKNPRRSGRRKN
jgi:hypothetical protein